MFLLGRIWLEKGVESHLAPADRETWVACEAGIRRIDPIPAVQYLPIGAIFRVLKGPGHGVANGVVVGSDDGVAVCCDGFGKFDDERFDIEIKPLPTRSLDSS